MSRAFASKATSRAIAASIGPAAGVGSLFANRHTIRCDTPSLAASYPPRQSRPAVLELSPEAVTQISSGSITGFSIGVVVTLFSRTFALLTGLVAVALHVASRFGLNVPRMLGIQKYLNGNALWERTKGKPLYTVSFLTTFFMATAIRL